MKPHHSSPAEDGQKVERRKSSYVYQAVCVVIVDLLTLTSGMMQTWTSPVLPMLDLDGDDNPIGRHVTTSEKSWIGSLLPLGAMFGPFVSAYCAQKFGRKRAMIGIAAIFAIGIIVLIFSNEIYLIYIGRTIAGLSHGSVFTVVPVYLAEISKVSNRGIIGNSIGISAMIGTFLSYAIGPYLAFMTFNIICLIPPCLFIALSIFIPETPQQLISSEHDELGMKVYTKLGIGDEKDFEEEKKFVRERTSAPIHEIFTKNIYIKTTLIVLAITCFKQLSGATVIQTYTQDIFIAAGTDIAPELSSMIVGSFDIVGALIAPLTVDRYGRKIMMMIAMGGTMAALFSIGLFFYLDDDVLFWLPILCLVISKLCYGFGFVSIIWILMAEILPQKIKSPASAIVNSIYWFVQFALTFAFPLMAEELGMSVSFWIFAGFNACGLLFVILVLPETKGKSQAEIERILTKNSDAAREYLELRLETNKNSGLINTTIL